MITQFMFMLIITWSLFLVVGTIKISNYKKCKKIACNFDH
jgi:hypothetical protein